MKTNSNKDIEKKLIAITRQLLLESGELHKREITLDASLQRHLGIDSLTRAELFRRIEKTFDVSLPDRLLAEAETLSDVVHYLQEGSTVVKAKMRPEIITSHGEISHVDPSQTHTLLDVLLLYGKKSPDRPHIYFQNEEGQEEIITYGQLLKNALRIAHALRLRGLGEGETVAIMQPTHPNFFYTFFGTLLAGGIPVPIYPPFRMHALEAYAKQEARILQNAGVRILVTFHAVENFSRLLQAFVPSLKEVTTADALLQQPEELTAIFAAKANHFALIQYTSGSTSDPKGVLLTHENLLANIRAYGKAIRLVPEDVIVSWLPLYHDMGLIGAWFGSLYFGIPLVLLTPFTFLNHPERWLWAIHYHRGTLSAAPNFAYELCMRKIDSSVIEGLDLSSWRVAANGAEKVYPRTLEQFADKFARYGFKRHALLPVYGLAESTVGLAIPPLNRDFRIDYVDRKLFEKESRAVPSRDKHALSFVACGKPIEGHEVRIEDEAGNVLSERRVGYLQFRGPSSMQGYYNNPRATAEVYHEGWIDSGDLAYQADGEIFITGRCKDLIIKAGRNLYPAEIEELIGNVADVRRGCVVAFGTGDPQRGTEKLIVVAETREKNNKQREKITHQIVEEISTTLDIVPDEVVLVAPHIIPKTSSGKLQRSACKTLYLERRLDKKYIPAWLQAAKLGAQWTFFKVMSGVRWSGKLIYTAYVAAICSLTIPFLWVLVQCASRDFSAAACRTFAKVLALLVFCPIKVVGRENLFKVTPVIFAANHASYIDSIILLACVPPATRFVGKKELFSTPFIRTFMRALDYLPVDRVDLPKGLEDTKQIERALKADCPILIFPEGTFGYAAGLRPFRLGAFKVAAEANVPVCPIALKGTRSILRAGEKLFFPERIEVTAMPPIYPQGSDWEDITQLRNLVRAEVVKYCGEPSLDFIAPHIIAPRKGEF